MSEGLMSAWHDQTHHQRLGVEKVSMRAARIARSGVHFLVPREIGNQSVVVVLTLGCACSRETMRLDKRTTRCSSHYLVGRRVEMPLFSVQP